jgi:hypothetical protein
MNVNVGGRQEGFEPIGGGVNPVTGRRGNQVNGGMGDLA